MDIFSKDFSFSSAQRGLPIGIFDSGVGGMTVLKELRNELPNESFLYLGDTARTPYGSKSTETVQKYSVEIAEFLYDRGIKLLVIACNTATAAALKTVQETLPDIEVVGVIESGAKAACRATKNKHIAVIATASTIRGHAYEQAILRHLPDVRLTLKPCPLFVSIAEEGLISGSIAETIAAYYLNDIFSKDSKEEEVPDTLLLACTHFPLLKNTIKKVVGDKITLVDSAANTAKAVHQILLEKNLARSSGATAGVSLCPGSVRFLATDDTERFLNMGKLFLGIPINPCVVEKVSL